MTTDAVGGVWTYSIELARGLARHGVRVTLATMGPEPSERQREEAHSIPDLELHTSTFALEWMRNPWREVDAAGHWLLDLAERVRADVVHLNGYAHAALPWPAPTLVMCHSDVLSWWQAVKGADAPVDEWGEYTRRVRDGLRSAGMVLAPTEAVRQDVERNYGPFGGIRVVPNGRAATDFQPSPKRNLVFSAGRFWDEAKNLAALRTVAPELPWPVYLAGDTGDDRPRCPNLNFLGRLSPTAVGTWLGRSAIYALPARYEPFGLSILEAALSGCALVLGDIPSLRELWGGAALFVHPDRPGELQNAIESLLRDEGRRTHYAEAARARAADYTVANMACGTLFAYQDLLQANVMDLAFSTRAGVSVQ
jgi:glycosyltransferase involved in cell wall biosynthesis